ncbi:MAG TPA: hypothetical protein VNM90_22850 [Haliangium sp.]|nr:hypothetical protein [Haliangium sp.]
MSAIVSGFVFAFVLAFRLVAEARSAWAGQAAQSRPRAISEAMGRAISEAVKRRMVYLLPGFLSNRRADRHGLRKCPSDLPALVPDRQIPTICGSILRQMCRRHHMRSRLRCAGRDAVCASAVAAAQAPAQPAARPLVASLVVQARPASA